MLWLGALAALYGALLLWLCWRRPARISVEYDEIIDLRQRSRRDSDAQKARLLSRRRRQFLFGSAKGIPVHIWEHISGRPLGTVVWDGALALCEFFESLVEKDRDVFRRKTVIELGAGTGLVGLYLALHGARVLVTDLPVLLPLLLDNVALNASAIEEVAASSYSSNPSSSVLTASSSTLFASSSSLSILSLFSRSSVIVRSLVWGPILIGQPTRGPAPADPALLSTLSPELEAELWQADDAFEVVVGADLLYVEYEIFEALLDTLVKIAKQPTVVYLAGTRRHSEETTYLARLRHFFNLEDLSHELQARAASLSPPLCAATSSAVRGFSIAGLDNLYLFRLQKKLRPL